MLEPNYSEIRLLEIRAGRRFWQSEFLAENSAEFYKRVVQPLRQLQRRGVIEKIHEITSGHDKTPVAVEVIGRVALAPVNHPAGSRAAARLEPIAGTEPHVANGQQ